jgi:hypothetical protein
MLAGALEKGMLRLLKSLDTNVRPDMLNLLNNMKLVYGPPEKEP